MTNFPNDPYDQGASYSGGAVYVQPGEAGVSEPSRTSLLAIAALVTGIIGLVICCIPVVSPVVGALAVFTGIGAMISISSSNGRRRGKALAITGFVCGLISVILGVFIAVGGSQLAAELNKIVGNYAPALQAAESGDVAGFNAMTNGSAQVSEAELRMFADSYRGTLGNYKSVDPSVLNMVKAFMAPGARQELETLQKSPAVASRQVAVIPSLWSFDKGEAVVILMVEPATGTAGAPAGLLEDIIIVDKATGTVVTRLSDVLAPALSPDGTLPVKPVPDLSQPAPDAPSAPDAPAEPSTGEPEPASNPS